MDSAFFLCETPRAYFMSEILQASLLWSVNMHVTKGFSSNNFLLCFCFAIFVIDF